MADPVYLDPFRRVVNISFPSTSDFLCSPADADEGVGPWYVSFKNGEWKARGPVAHNFGSDLSGGLIDWKGVDGDLVLIGGSVRRYFRYQSDVPPYHLYPYKRSVYYGKRKAGNTTGENIIGACIQIVSGVKVFVVVASSFESGDIFVYVAKVDDVMSENGAHDFTEDGILVWSGRAPDTEYRSPFFFNASGTSARALGETTWLYYIEGTQESVEVPANTAITLSVSASITEGVLSAGVSISTGEIYRPLEDQATTGHCQSSGGSVDRAGTKTITQRGAVLYAVDYKADTPVDLIAVASGAYMTGQSCIIQPYEFPIRKRIYSSNVILEINLNGNTYKIFNQVDAHNITNADGSASYKTERGYVQFVDLRNDAIVIATHTTEMQATQFLGDGQVIHSFVTRKRNITHRTVIGETLIETVIENTEYEDNGSFLVRTDTVYCGSCTTGGETPTPIIGLPSQWFSSTSPPLHPLGYDTYWQQIAFDFDGNAVGSIVYYKNEINNFYAFLLSGTTLTSPASIFPIDDDEVKLLPLAFVGK